MNDLNNYAKRFITAKSRNHSQGSISLMENKIDANLLTSGEIGTARFFRLGRFKEEEIREVIQM
jgi:hypothetical protein